MEPGSKCTLDGSGSSAGDECGQGLTYDWSVTGSAAIAGPADAEPADGHPVVNIVAVQAVLAPAGEPHRVEEPSAEDAVCLVFMSPPRTEGAAQPPAQFR